MPQRFPEFNSAWFKEQMQRHDMTYGDVATLLNVEVKSARSVAHKIMNGELKLNPEGAAILSQKFGVPLETVLKEAGQLDARRKVDTKEHKLEQSALLHGGRLLSGREFPRKDRKAVRVPPGIPADTLVVKLGDPASPLAGWTAFCSSWLPLAPAQLDKLMLVQAGETVVLGKLRRGSAAGHYFVETLGGATPEFRGTLGSELFALTA